MAVPITNMKLSDIKNELGIPSPYVNSIRELFNYGGVHGSGLDNTYCPGIDGNARLINLRTLPYQIGKWRNYDHSIQPPVPPSFDIINDVLIYTQYNIYKLNTTDFTVTELGSLPTGGGLVDNKITTSSIAMSSTKIYQAYLRDTEVRVFNVTYTPSFNITYSHSIELSQWIICGIYCVTNNNEDYLTYGFTFTEPTGYYENVRVGSVNVNDTQPITIGSSFLIDNSLWAKIDSVDGDITIDSVNGVIYMIISDYEWGNTQKPTIRKFNYFGDRISEENYTNNIGSILFIDSIGRLINITYNGEVWEINKSNYDRSLIGNCGDLGWIGASRVYPAPSSE